MSARLILLVALLVAILLRVQVSDVPLERDEGEYAYMGQLILRGEIPYLAAHNMKFPGTYYAYAAILWLLGESAVAIRLALLGVNLLTTLLLYRMGAALLDRVAGATAALVFATLSLDPSVLGFSAKAEHFVLPPVLGAFLLLVHPPPHGLGRLILMGLLLGVAVLMKQHAAAFLIFAGIWVALQRPWAAGARNAAILVLVALVPFAAICLALHAAGAFEPFWFWTIRYASEYATLVPIEVGLGELARRSVEILSASLPLWLLVLLGTTALGWDLVARSHAAFLLTFTAFSLLAVTPGLRFSEHYFLLVLPAASLLAGVGTSALARRLASCRPTLAPPVAFGLPVVAALASLVPEPVALFSQPPAEIARSVFGANPFPEAIEVARYLETQTTPAERIAVIGSEPEIYFLARRRAAVSYMYVYPLMEPQPFAQQMQADLIAQLQRERPRFMVLVNVPTSWSLQPDSSRELLTWVERSVNEDYTLVGLLDILPDGRTLSRWDDEAAQVAPQSPHHVAVFRRNDGR